VSQIGVFVYALSPPTHPSGLNTMLRALHSCTRVSSHSPVPAGAQPRPLFSTKVSRKFVQQSARVPSEAVARRRFSTTICMAEAGTGAKLDQSTPDSTWKKVLSAQQVNLPQHHVPKMLCMDVHGSSMRPLHLACSTTCASLASISQARMIVILRFRAGSGHGLGAMADLD